MGELVKEWKRLSCSRIGLEGMPTLARSSLVANDVELLALDLDWETTEGSLLVIEFWVGRETVVVMPPAACLEDEEELCAPRMELTERCWADCKKAALCLLCLAVKDEHCEQSLDKAGRTARSAGRAIEI